MDREVTEEDQAKPLIEGNGFQITLGAIDSFKQSYHLTHIFNTYKLKAITRGDTMQKWHIFRKNEKFSKRSDGF